MEPSRLSAVYGDFWHSKSLDEVELLEDTLITLDRRGRISAIVPRYGRQNAERLDKATTWVTPEDTFILPGFVDAHTHAPQYINLGLGYGLPLLTWLDQLTYPTEARFKDEAFATREYRKVIQLTLSGGTTTCCYYSSIHLGASKILADLALELGQRAFIGKCNIDRKETSSPDYVEASAEDSIAETRKFVAYCRKLDPSGELVSPVITPRFALSCSQSLLASLGSYAQKEDLPVQTHISENVKEIKDTKALFRAERYADIYAEAGLLTKRTILAHAVHLTREEIKLIRTHDSGIAHCPSSNFNLGSGVCPVQRLLKEGVRLGLGTDVSGGHNTSILQEMQSARVASAVVQMTEAGVLGSSSAPSHLPSKTTPAPPLSIERLLYMATLGGASLCRLDHLIGSFAEGKAFDAMQVTLQGRHPSAEATLEQFIATGKVDQISHVWIDGRHVHGP